MYELKKIKSDVRRELLELRHAIPGEQKEKMDAAIAERFFSGVSFRHSSVVLTYVSTAHETGTAAIIRGCLEKGKAVACPRTDPERGLMKFLIIKSEDDLEPGNFGLLEPKEGCPDYADYAAELAAKEGRPAQTVCIIPCLAIDHGGFRIGYGKGFYDRFLSEYDGLKIGICYSECVRKELPHGKYDVKLDVGITEKKITVY